MITKERDSKFIIYQVLYIFVITVLALKGADLDLNRVVASKEVVKKSVRDSLVTIIDSLYAKGINFDIKVDENIAVENVALKEKLSSMKKQLSALTQKIKEIPPEERMPPKEVPVKEQAILQSPLSVTQTFIQYTWNKAKNNGSVPSGIYDPADMTTPIVVIPPGQEKTFDLTNQNEVIVKFGSQEQRIKVLPNKPPEVKIDAVTTKMNSSDIYVKDLQRITVFKVTIIDERPDQLKVTYSGPISVSKPEKDSKGNPVYNVSLNIASTESKFDQWLDRNKTLRESDGRYKANFFFTIVDEKSKDRVQVGDSFYFTDFSR
jgi:hypothetical protein